MIARVVLAAGAGRRFGSAKQVAILDGHPLLHHALQGGRRARGLGRRTLVLGAHADAVLRVVDVRRYEVVHCPEWSSGPGASLRCGLAAALPDATAVVVLLGDQPDVPREVIERFVALGEASGPSALARAQYDGTPGHPVLLGAEHAEALLQRSDGGGAAGHLAAHAAQEVPCGSWRLGRDVDVPGDLERR